MKRWPVHSGVKLRPGLKRSGQGKTIRQDSELKGLRRTREIKGSAMKLSVKLVGG
jgi:hypothetical protein